MLGSLYTGVSGLKAHLQKLDVIANNIANVNTIGFKGSRTVFEEALAALIHSAARPTENMGGRNPMQVGTGVKLASIDNLFEQGGIASTGVPTDLAIQGEGFFILKDPTGTYYSRAGAFRLDSLGRLVTPDGLLLQGVMADADGNIVSGAALENIVLPLEEKVPARATTEVAFTCNLDMGKDPLETILDSSRILADATGTDEVSGLFDDSGNRIVMGTNDITFDIDTTDATVALTLAYEPGGSDTLADIALNPALVGDGKFTTLEGLAAELQNYIQGYGGHAADTVTFATVNLPSGETTQVIQWVNSAAESNVAFTSSNDILENMFSAWNGSVAAANVDSDKFLGIAEGADALTDLCDSSGQWLDLVAGDTIDLSGKDGTSPITNSHLMALPDTLDTFCTWIETDFNIAEGGDAYIDSDGKLVIKGDKGTDDNLEVSITEAGNTVFNTIMALNETQSASDIIHTTSIIIYDSLGSPHTLSMKFQKDDVTPNLWHWTATLDSGTIISGGSGDVRFNSDGSLASPLTYAGGVSAFTFDPGAGAASPMRIDFNAGTPGEHDGITQSGAPTTTVASAQDGYTMGTLDSISIDGTGTIIGSFSNGVLRNLSQVRLAKFANPSGLLKHGNTMWQESTNSGIPIAGSAGKTIASTISAGYLEQSNIDLAREFTEMIIAQRGFQATSKIITLSDDMLAELVRLKR